jgi:hypothetical protein
MQFSVGKTHSIVKSLNEECKKQLENAISETMPIEYQASISLHKAVMTEALAIAHSEHTKDPRTRLEALRVAADARKYLDSILGDSAKVVEVAGGVVGNQEGQEGRPTPQTTRGQRRG